MVYDPATNEQIVETYASIFEEVNDFLLQLTAETLLEGKSYDGSITDWLQFKQSSVAKLLEEAGKQADKSFNGIKPSITAAVEAAYSIGESTAAAELLSVGLPVDVGSGFQGLAEYSIEALIDGAVNRFQNRANKLNVVRATQDVYAEVTEEVAALVTSGVATLEEAVEIAVDRFLDKGIKTVQLGNKNMQIDDYANTAIRTIAGNAQVQGSLDRYEDAEQYLVFITDSPMECSLCRPFEGKVLRTTEDLSKVPEEYHGSEQSLEYAKGKGLFHPNCTHSAQMYIEGYSTPPTDTDDEANTKRRAKIRRLDKLERTNRLKEKIYRKDGQTNRAKGAKARATKYRAERRQLEAAIERKSLGWFTGEDRLRRLAEANGIKPEVLIDAKGNLPKLNKLAKSTGFDPRLVSPDVRRGVAAVKDPPDISDILEATGVKDYRELPESIRADLRLKYKDFFESEFGVMNFLEGEGKFHNPPALPDKVKKMNKVQFNKWIKENRKDYTNRYGNWRWDNKKGKPDFKWRKKHITDNWTGDIENLLEEAEAAGALSEKKQVVAGGLPSSGKTFTLANKAGDPSLKTYKLDEYVILNSDDFKTKIIFRDYASATDKRLNDLLSDTFINDPDFGVGSKLGANNPVMKKLKTTHPEIYKEILGKEFDKGMLTEIRELVASKVPIGDTGLFGYEAANILHEESSAMLKAAQEAASDKGLNIVHDVTMGSAKPVELVEDLVDAKGYEPAEVMFIMYSQEQASDSVIDRYIRKNFDTDNNRGGRYVMSIVLDDATKKIKDPAFANKTIDLLGRPALTDNEVFLSELLKSDAVSQNADDIQLVNRYSDIDFDTGQAKAYPVEIVKDTNGNYKVTTSASKNKKVAIDGMKVRTKSQIDIPTNKAGIDEFDKVIEAQVLQTPTGRNIGIKSEFYERIVKRDKYFKDLKLKPDDAGLYIIAKEKGFTGKPEKVALPTDLTDVPLTESNTAKGVVNPIGGGVNIVNEAIEEDLIVYRGISDTLDQDQDTWQLQDTKVPAADRLNSIQKTMNFFDDDRIAREVTDLGIPFYEGDTISNRIKRTINNMNINIDSNYIDAETFKEAQEEFRKLKLKDIENGTESFFTSSYFTQSQELVDKGFIDISLLGNEEFQIIYDEKLYGKGINVKQVKQAPLVKSGMDIHKEFIDGDYYAGNSAVYGYGTYTDTEFSVAKDYSQWEFQTRGRGSGGVVQVMKIKAGTRMPSAEVLKQVEEEVHLRNVENSKLSTKGGYNEDNVRVSRELSQTVEYDVGRRLAAMGYQAYDVNMLESTVTHVVILDRTAVVVAEQPLMIDGKVQY